MSFIPDVALGENSRIQIGGADLLVQSGSVVENPAKIGTGCNLTGGFTTKTRGLFNLMVDAKAQWTPDENPFNNAPALQPGEDVEDVKVYPDIVNQPGVFYDMPIAYCEQATCDIDANPQGGVISYSFKLENQGEYGTPTQPLA